MQALLALPPAGVLTPQFGDFLRYLTVERHLAPATTKRYTRELRALGAVDTLPDLSTADLRAALFRCSTSLSARTIAGKIASWSAYYRWLVWVDYRPDDPTMKLSRPRLPKSLPRPINDLADVLARMQAAGDTRTYWIAVLLASTGFRIGEACEAVVESPAPSVLRVLGKGSKEREVPLSSSARAAFEALGGRIGIKPRAVQRRFAKYGIHPHACRHTFATRCIQADVPIAVLQQLMGHASSATTNIYAQIADSQKTAAAELVAVQL